MDVSEEVYEYIMRFNYGKETWTQNKEKFIKQKQDGGLQGAFGSLTKYEVLNRSQREEDRYAEVQKI